MRAQRVIADPDQRDADLTVVFGTWVDPHCRAVVRGRVVGDQGGYPGQRALADGIEWLLGALDRVHSRDQRLGIDRTGAEQPDELLEVALLGPADIPERVVDPALLIAGVVAPRPVGARVPQIDLAVQEVLRVDVELDIADQYHTALSPGDFHGRVDDVRRVRAGADHRSVYAVLPGEIEYASLPLGVGRVRGHGGGRSGGQLVRLGVDVDTDNDASGCLRDAGGKLPDEAEAVDRHRLTELQVSAPQGLDSDAADRDKSGVPKVDAARDRNHVADKRGGYLGVAAGRIRHRLADLEPFHVVAEREHGPRTAVADLAGRDHLVPDPTSGLAGAGGEDGLLDDMPHPRI